MANHKHVGRIAKTKASIVVAYRVVPGEPENCIVITTSNLSADEHDTLIKAVESEAGQQADEFANVMARVSLPDGRNMLAWFHASGKMQKVPTNTIEMMPNRNTSIMLNELNDLIAQQRGVTVADLAIGGARPAKTPEAPVPTADAVAGQVGNNDPLATQVAEDGVLTDDTLAAQMRSQADAMFKEAKRLREEAESLVPTPKKTTARKNIKKADDKVT
jgi:hypothetical protein